MGAVPQVRGRGHLLSRAQFTTWTCPRLLAAVPSSADPSGRLVLPREYGLAVLVREDIGHGESRLDHEGRSVIRRSSRGSVPLPTHLPQRRAGGTRRLDRLLLRIPTMPITDSGACRSPPEKRSSIAALGHSGLGLYRTRFSGPTGDTCLGRPEVVLGQWECLLGHQ